MFFQIISKRNMKLVMCLGTFFFVNLIFLISNSNIILGKTIRLLGEENGIIQRSEVLGAKGEFKISWIADLNKNIIDFDLLVETVELIKLGISQNRNSELFEDFFIAAIHSNGSSQIRDYHKLSEIKEDKQQDWKVLFFNKNVTHTQLKVRRNLKTCDEIGDIVINENTFSLNWGYGQVNNSSLSLQNIQLEKGQCGSILVNFLDLQPEGPKENDLERWDLTRSTEMTSGRHTSYWCTVHKGPVLQRKNHIVKFVPHFEDSLAKKHIHHLVLYKCRLPQKSNLSLEEYFDPYTKSGGWECYESYANSPATSHCRSFVYVWGYGGKELTLPEDVGIPIGENSSEYYMLEVHYNNPEFIPNLELRGGIKMHYTSELRTHEAGVFMLGHDFYPTLVVPPKSENFDIFGHCSGECTWSRFPPEGIKVFGVLPHSHLKGRQMQLHHFRKNQELEWVLNDKTYNFGFQQTRWIPKRRRVLPGDHMTMRCTYSNFEDVNGGSTVGGFSTQEEMCLGFIWYYPKIILDACTSAYSLDELKKFFGITKVTGRRGLIQPVVLEPLSMQNKTLSEVMDTIVEWTSEKRAELQERLRMGPHVTECTGKGSRSSRSQSPLTTYPTVEKPYESLDLSDAHCPMHENILT